MRRCATPLLVMLIVACDAGSDTVPGDLPEPRRIEVPAAAGSGQPYLSAWGESVILSWTEPSADGHALRFATLQDDDTWSAARTVASGSNWFVNWADFPSVTALSDTELAAHWLQRSGRGRYSYDVLVSRSADAGASWSEGVRPHRDGTPTEHGFVSLFPLDGAAGVVWLDGRRFVESEAGPKTDEMTVRFTRIDAAGTAAPELLLDDRACDCCQTDAGMTARGPIVVYRDRSPDEVRDIVITRLIDGEWTPPAPVHPDGWTIAGCPVNGPQLDTRGDDVAVAWFTAANDTPRVHLVFSDDGGARFTPVIRVDDGNPAGRADVLLLDARTALVLWLENAGGGGEVRARVVRRDGARSVSRVVAATSSQRASGFPRMARRGSSVVIAWTEPGEPAHVRAAILPLPQ